MVTEVTKGKLIVVDGMDGAGKTTAMGYIRKALADSGERFEPVNILSNNPTSAEIRKILTSPESYLVSKAEMLLYAAAINNTYWLDIYPRLQSGINVLVDRGPLSNFAYQIQNTKHPYFGLWKQFYMDFKADTTLILTCDLEEGLKRCVQRDGKLDRIEAKGHDFHKAVHDAYLDIRDAEINAVRTHKKSDFSEVTGKCVFYSNNATLSHLEEMCRYFVQKTLTTSA